jgi:VWFA-related protein
MKSVQCIVMVCVLVVGLRAQQVSTISTTANLVTLLATVRDRNGHIVSNLTADDFVVEDDGVPQKVRFFSQEFDLPLTVGMLVDTSRSQQGVLGKESKASNTFLEQVLTQGKDQAFITHFDIRVETLQGLTSSRSELKAALNRLQIPDQVSTLLFSAIRESSHDLLQTQTGRKAIILLTDGVAFRDPTSIEDAIESAQRADTILYAIRFSDPAAVFRPFRAAVRAAASEHGKVDLKRMTAETGGTSYDVSGSQGIEAIYSLIEEELRNEYSIAYIPPVNQRAGEYHEIRLTTKDHSLLVDTRKGYYAR